jgi:5-methyltetrahydropteroyltriglutamate--homocysteine methyltransferase
LHIDAINGCDEVQQIRDWLPAHKILILGIIDEHNLWKTDLNQTLNWILYAQSLTHKPVKEGKRVDKN